MHITKTVQADTVRYGTYIAVVRCRIACAALIGHFGRQLHIAVAHSSQDAVSTSHPKLKEAASAASMVKP
jgi:hypothetical protein